MSLLAPRALGFGRWEGVRLGGLVRLGKARWSFPDRLSIRVGFQPYCSGAEELPAHTRGQKERPQMHAVAEFRRQARRIRRPKFNLHVFRIVQRLRSETPRPFRQEEVSSIGMTGRLWTDRAEPRPLRGDKTRLLRQLTFSRRLGRLSRFHRARRKLQGRCPNAVPVLPNQDQILFGCHCNNGNPIGRVEQMKLRDFNAALRADPLLTNGEPATLDHTSLGQYLPRTRCHGSAIAATRPSARQNRLVSRCPKLGDNLGSGGQ